MLSVTDRLLIMSGILLQHLFSSLWQLCTVGHGIFYMADVNNFFRELNSAYFSRHLF